MLFVLAAFVPDRQLRRSGLGLPWARAGVTTALLLTIVLVPALRSPVAAPGGGFPGARLVRAARPAPASGAVRAAARGGGALRCGRTSGSCGVRGGAVTSSLGWLAIAAMLAAASQVNYLLYGHEPAVPVRVATRSGVAFYAVLLLGSMREIWSYWHALSKAAVLEERQRIACELHDGVAQELAYLARNLESLDGEADEDGLDRLRRAVERAQLESRRAISAAAAPGGQPFEVALAEAVTEVAERYHVELDLDLTPDIRLLGRTARGIRADSLRGSDQRRPA